MSNIIDYVKDTANLSFAEKEFCIEDALVLCQFCYLKFDGMVDGVEGGAISLADINKRDDKDRLFAVKAYEKDNRALYEAILESTRFGGMMLSNHVNRIDLESKSQFSTITYTFASNDIMFVAYRGTDETMVGWEEDFELSLKKPIRGQTLSARFLNLVADKADRPFMVGGHSKGGNLALYAALCCRKSTRKRIEKIYNFDGPGYRPEYLESEASDYEEIKDRHIKVIPKASPVGYLLVTPGEVKVIEAKSVGVLQHNPYNWVIKNNELVYTEPSEQHLVAMKTFNDWLLSLNDEEIKEFVDMLCKLLDATTADTTSEFKAHMPEYTKTFFNELDDKTKELLSIFMKSYFDMAGEIIREDVHEKIVNAYNCSKYATFSAEIEKKVENLFAILDIRKTKGGRTDGVKNSIKSKGL